MDNNQRNIYEAIEEQKQIFGYERQEQQWILTSWDSWEKNPYYSGPPQRHPEDDYDEDGVHYLEQ